MIALETQGKNSSANTQKNVYAPPSIIKPGQLAGLSYGQTKSDPLKQAWGSWLDGREWQLWTTLTTGRELTLPGSRRAINKLAGYLKQHHYPAEIFWAAEPFDLKEGYHLHSLVRFTDLTVMDDNKQAYGNLINGWRQITGDKSARIYSERYQPDKGANYYLAKYMQKNRSDYDYISPHLDNKNDQIEDPGIYAATLAEQMKARQIEASKESWRKVTAMEFQKKGIFVGKADPEKLIYTDSRITYEQWEAKEYKKDLTARLTVYSNRLTVCNKALALKKNISIGQFTVSTTA